MAPFHPAEQNITFRSVSFSYVPGEPVLKELSFTAPAGKLTAIVGDSGSGKSTILNLIAKYYEPQSGEISIGGQSIETVAAERVLEQISMVVSRCSSLTIQFGRISAMPAPRPQTVRWRPPAVRLDVTALYRSWSMAMTPLLGKTEPFSPAGSVSVCPSPGLF